ncbi:hypothetical protein [Lapidilactobacillus gannanensis]|uniref:Phage protein n=1 Tax=Lapidilactobacillus gannanensis TaxID=2486002 RepID=A0ABW4BN42_9LACO|nr:hypothetical protein [Lapidilactobacillus gannanensis]
MKYLAEIFKALKDLPVTMQIASLFLIGYVATVTSGALMKTIVEIIKLIYQKK